MSVTAVIKIQQFDVDTHSGDIQETILSASNDGDIQEFVAVFSGETTQHSLPAISSPTSRDSSAGGFVTVDENNWSDSPDKKPLLLYRQRFGWGRDNQEIFIKDGRAALAVGSEGQRWGNLDDNSAEVIYEQQYPLSSYGSIRQFSVESIGSIQEKVYTFSSDFLRITEFGEVAGETTINEFPFLLVAVPDPFSEKNPVATNVFIRLSNFTNTISSGTITLHLDDILQAELGIEEFFGGLGGFDITWTNNFIFNYDAQVNVKWTFFDTDIPANGFIIRYPFYTVPDLAGPRVSNLVPSDESTEVPISGTLQFDVEDFEQDVDLTSLVLYVNNVKIVDGEQGTIQTTRLGNEKGYTIKFTPGEPWLYGDLIPVAIFIKDTSINSNETFFAYSFTTAESSAPRLIAIEPPPCATDVPTGTDISVDVIDGGHGLDKTTIVVTIEEVEKTKDAIIIPIIHRDE